LIRRGARDVLDEELRHAGAHVVAIDARDPRIDDVDDAGDRERGLGDVRREHDASSGAAALEHARLLLRGEARVEREDGGVRERALLELAGGLADLALAGEEHEDVAARIHLGDLVHRVRDGLREIRFLLGRRPIQHVDGIRPPGDLDHRRAAEELREPLGLERRGADDHPQVGPLRDQPLQEPEEEVDVQRALVRLVDDDRAVRAEQRIVLDLREQHAVGEELDVRVARDLVVEPDLVADDIAELRLELLGDARGDARRGDPARLRAADVAVLVALATLEHREADLRELRRLPGARLAGDDHDLVVVDRAGDVLDARADREVLGERDPHGEH